MKHELYKTKEDIERWLNKYSIKNYEIIEDKEYGYVVNVNENVNLRSKNLKEIKIKFNVINGDFICSNNQLTTLMGCPEEVTKYFHCSNNLLTNLKYSPKIINNFYCSNNQLESLEGCPEKINGSFYCNNNKLKSLNYSPKKINGTFNCNNNQLESLKYSPKTIKENFFCNNNQLNSLEGCPNTIKGYLECTNNKLNTLEFFPKNITCDCILNNNPELYEIQYIENVNELKKIHEKTVFNKKLEKEISIENNIKNVKIKL